MLFKAVINPMVTFIQIVRLAEGQTRTLAALKVEPGAQLPPPLTCF